MTLLMPAILFDVAPGPGGIGTFLAVGFFFLLAAVAFIAFKLLRKTVKMAFRMVIVGLILAIAVAGSVSLWFFSSGRPDRPRPRPRQVQNR